MLPFGLLFGLPCSSVCLSVCHRSICRYTMHILCLHYMLNCTIVACSVFCGCNTVTITFEPPWRVWYLVALRLRFITWNELANWLNKQIADSFIRAPKRRSKLFTLYENNKLQSYIQYMHNEPSVLSIPDNRPKSHITGFLEGGTAYPLRYGRVWPRPRVRRGHSKRCWFFLLDPQNSSDKKALFMDTGKFWCCCWAQFPNLTKKAFEVIVPFDTTYRCEQSFSVMIVVKKQAAQSLGGNVCGWPSQRQSLELRSWRRVSRPMCPIKSKSNLLNGCYWKQKKTKNKTVKINVEM